MMLRINFLPLILCFVILTFGIPINTSFSLPPPDPNAAVTLIILGTIQDAGSPHIACKKDCCKDLFLQPDKDRKVVSLGLVDRKNDFTVLVEATPDITEQLKLLKTVSLNEEKEIPDAVFITHAHIGHYAGLMYFGKEAVNTRNVPVYVMPRMKSFIENNGPWSQLVSNKNVELLQLENNKPVTLTPDLNITPVLVPHRDEYSETVGFRIEGPNKKVLFIPDIDKWQKWDLNITSEITKYDYVFIDATFYSGEEINARDITQIPHPFIQESMSLLDSLPLSEKNKVYFIHMNHTNPAIRKQSKEYQNIVNSGYKVAQINDVFQL